MSVELGLEEKGVHFREGVKVSGPSGSEGVCESEQRKSGRGAGAEESSWEFLSDQVLLRGFWFLGQGISPRLLLRPLLVRVTDAHLLC